MSDPMPQPTLEQALEQLRNLPTFQQVVEFVTDEREDMIARFSTVTNDGEAMKTAGGVAAIDRILAALRG